MVLPKYTVLKGSRAELIVAMLPMRTRLRSWSVIIRSVTSLSRLGRDGKMDSGNTGKSGISSGSSSKRDKGTFLSL